MSAAETKTKKVCAECGSDSVERMVWADVNTDKVRGEVTEPSPYCRACDQNVTLTDVPVTRYLILAVGSWCVALPALWVNLDVDAPYPVIQSNLTRVEVVEWEGPLTGSRATVLDHNTPGELRGYMRAGDIDSLHVLVNLIYDMHDAGWIGSRETARLLGGDA